jgi:nucleotide exchange factor SIL1
MYESSRLTLVLLLLCSSYCLVLGDESSKVSNNIERPNVLDNKKVFVPTNEWQDIDSDQPVPSGLHYRMNFETHKVEAKLLEPDTDQKSESQALAPIAGVEVVDHKNELPLSADQAQLNDSKARLKAAFAKMRLSDESGQNDKTAEEVKSKFRSIDELRQHLGDLKLNMSSETEAMGKLLHKYEQAVEQDKLTILTDLEFYLHQIDVANDFVRMNGLAIMSKDLTIDRIGDVQGKISQALSAGASGNKHFQAEMIASKTYDKLLILLSTADPKELTANVLHVVHSVFTCARQTPSAQQTMLQTGLLEQLFPVFSIRSPLASKLQIKLIDFLYDIQMERKFAEQDLNAALQNLGEAPAQQKQLTNARNRFNDYEQVRLAKHIVDSQLCKTVPMILEGQSLDRKERILQWMNAFLSQCKQQFAARFEYLQQLAHELRMMRDQDEKAGDSTHFYSSMLDQVDQLLEHIQLVRTDAN